MNHTTESKLVKKDNVGQALASALDAGGGLLRLDPDLGAAQLSASRASGSSCTRTTGTPTARIAAASTSAGSPAPPKPPTRAACWTKGSASASFEGQQFLLSDAVAEAGAPADRQGDVRQVQPLAGLLEVLRQHGAHPPSHAPEFEHAKLTGQEGKPESYYFPPQLNNVDNNFAYTFMGLEPGTTKADVRKCLEDWNKGDNGILDLLGPIG